MSSEDKQNEAEKNQEQEQELSADDLKIVSGGAYEVFITVGGNKQGKI